MESKTDTFRISGGDNILFSFSLKRKPKFTVVNVILPIIFMAAINILVFVLPAESGERVGFSVTMLLALAVFLTLVGDNLPKTSKPTPILGDYLIAILVLSVMMIIMAIINLRFYYKPADTAPPKCLQALIKLVLCRLCRKRKISNVTEIRPFSFDKSDNKSPPEEADQEDKVTWQDFSFVADVFCFIIFVIAECAVNGYFLTTLTNGKQEK